MFLLNKMYKLSQKGAIPLLVLIAAIGLIIFLGVSSSVDFKDKIFSQLFPKPASRAASGPISEPIIPSPSASASATPSPTSAPDVTPPSVSITNPQNGSVVKKSSNVLITATALDNKGISKVEFSVNGLLLCTDTISPYSCSWNVGKQPRVKYNISAKAYDTSNNVSSHLISVTSK